VSAPHEPAEKGRTEGENMSVAENVVAGPTVLIDENLCKGCGLCIDVCPPGVLQQGSQLNHLGFHPAVYMGKWCNACGICFYACPEPGAIVVVKPSLRHE
jgi:2-oxoglutarate ferredoxin oxidoreductase subunit delta